MSTLFGLVLDIQTNFRLLIREIFKYLCSYKINVKIKQGQAYSNITWNYIIINKNVQIILFCLKLRIFGEFFIDSI